jgi:hypothetical protein
MRRLVGTLSVVVVSLAAASPVGAKEEYWAQICGQSGCKVIKDRFVAAAFTTEAEERGSSVRRSADAAYKVRYVIPQSGQTTGPTHWISAKTIDFIVRSSQPSVSDLLIRARSGVEPFPAASNGADRRAWAGVLVASALGVILVGVWLSKRRVLRKRLLAGESSSSSHGRSSRSHIVELATKRTRR